MKRAAARLLWLVIGASLLAALGIAAEYYLMVSFLGDADQRGFKLQMNTDEHR